MILENLLYSYKQLPVEKHIVWMIDEILKIEIPDTKQLFKINRWLGFIQGYLYTSHLRTIEELKNETRGIDDEFFNKIIYFGEIL